VRRLLLLAAVALGVWAVLRWRRSRSLEAAEPVVPESSPADDLRARIAESRAAEDAAPQEPAVEEPSTETAVEGKRRDVHERARQSIDELA
jgi:hypothetical protein